MMWTEARESSWFVRLFRAITQDGSLARFYRRMAAAAPLLFLDIQSKGAAANDEPVIRALRESLAIRAAVSMGALASLAAQQSQAGRLTARLREEVARLSVAQRIRMVALALLGAMVTHLLLTQFEAPEPTRAARLVWTALLVVVAGVMAGSSFLAAAWSEWSTRPERNGGNRE